MWILRAVLWCLCFEIVKIFPNNLAWNLLAAMWLRSHYLTLVSKKHAENDIIHMINNIKIACDQNGFVFHIYVASFGLLIVLFLKYSVIEIMIEIFVVDVSNVI